MTETGRIETPDSKGKIQPQNMISLSNKFLAKYLKSITDYGDPYFLVKPVTGEMQATQTGYLYHRLVATIDAPKVRWNQEENSRTLLIFQPAGGYFPLRPLTFWRQVSGSKLA